jgi:PIN domain nuclease of toxin-antitoxin system
VTSTLTLPPRALGARQTSTAVSSSRPWHGVLPAVAIAGVLSLAGASATDPAAPLGVEQYSATGANTVLATSAFAMPHAHASAVEAVLDDAVSEAAHSGTLIASVVSFAELLTGVELGHHDEQVVRGFFAKVIDHVIPVDIAVAERAALLRAERKSLKMPDALILATGDLHSERVITADDAWPKLTTTCVVDLMTE